MQALLTLHEVCSSWTRFSQRNQPKKVPSTYAAEHQGEGAERSRADVLQHHKAVLVLKSNTGNHSHVGIQQQREIKGKTWAPQQQA